MEEKDGFDTYSMTRQWYLIDSTLKLNNELMNDLKVKAEQNERTLRYLKYSLVVSTIICLMTFTALLFQILAPQSVELVGIEKVLKAQESLIKDKVQEELRNNQFFPPDTLVKNDHVKANIID